MLYVFCVITSLGTKILSKPGIGSLKFTTKHSSTSISASNLPLKKYFFVFKTKFSKKIAQRGREGEGEEGDREEEEVWNSTFKFGQKTSISLIREEGEGGEEEERGGEERKEGEEGGVKAGEEGGQREGMGRIGSSSGEREEYRSEEEEEREGDEGGEEEEEEKEEKRGGV